MSDEKILKEQFQKFFSDKELSTELLRCKTTEDAKKLLHKNGIDLKDEEMEVLREYLNKFMEKIGEAGENGQLSEEDLEQVSGGFLVGAALGNAFKPIVTAAKVIGVTLGVAAAATGIGFAAKAIYDNSKSKNENKGEIPSNDTSWITNPTNL